jgi:hypothetical protein
MSAGQIKIGEKRWNKQPRSRAIEVLLENVFLSQQNCGKLTLRA